MTSLACEDEVRVACLHIVQYFFFIIHFIDYCVVVVEGRGQLQRSKRSKYSSK
jgi:hypothetical protein